MTIIDTLFPNKFSTILEVDYDTPYRYFVGNDAHIIGPHGLANGHACPHQSASATSSSATNSTCCGNTPLSSQSSTGSSNSNVLTKTKSDASTSTTPEKDLNDTTVTTTAEIEQQQPHHHQNGVTNEGYQKGDEDEDSDVSTTIIDGKRAVSLHNFGKFAAQQQQRENKQQIDPTAMFRIRNPAATLQR